MHRDKLYSWTSRSVWVLCLAFATSVACGGEPDPDPDDGPPTSPTANVRFKDGKRLQRELARALAIAPGELCRELGQYDCFGIHAVVLGSADPFGVGLYEPLAATTSTSPIAFERVVLAACSERVTRDLEAPGSAHIFKNLALTPEGQLADIDDPNVGEAIDALYRHGLSRHATDTEVAHVKGLYQQILDSGQSTDPARDWATLGCFAVLTTMETIFY